MTTAAVDAVTPDPLAPPSSQFALNGSSVTSSAEDVPSAIGVRPWGLRRARAADLGRGLPDWTYDERQQKALDSNGTPLIDSPKLNDPTAFTTSSTDGEDPPSSEDWIND